MVCVAYGPAAVFILSTVYLDSMAALKEACLELAKTEMRDEAFVVEVVKLLRDVEITEPVHLQGEVDDYCFKTKLDGSKKSFIKKLLVKHTVRATADPYGSGGAAQSGGSGDGATNILERWMESRFGVPAKKKIVEVDLGDLMQKAKLRDLCHQDTWPTKTAVSELATQLQKCKFVASDLRKFLASFCKACLPVVLDDDLAAPSLVKEALAKAKTSKLLDFASWLIAWDRFAIAAAILEMIPYAVSMRYKLVSCVTNVFYFVAIVCKSCAGYC